MILGAELRVCCVERRAERAQRAACGVREDAVVGVTRGEERDEEVLRTAARRVGCKLSAARGVKAAASGVPRSNIVGSILAPPTDVGVERRTCVERSFIERSGRSVI